MNVLPFVRWNARHCAAAALSAGLLLIAGPDRALSADAPAATASFTPRPLELQRAIEEIRGKRPAEAQQRLQAFIEAEPKGLYTPEAHYLLGQSLAAQGLHKEAKKPLDKAKDKAPDRTLKALAIFALADCNVELGDFALASRQYHWLETMYRDVKAIPQDELMFKLGMVCKYQGATETADYWFRQVIDCYATGPFFDRAKQEHTAFNPPDPKVAPRVYSLEVSSFATREKADAEAQALREKGYRDVEVVATTENSFPKYEVHVGKFANRSDAMRAQTDAKLAGLPTELRPAIIEPLK